jgi:hypothetical protein
MLFMQIADSQRSQGTDTDRAGEFPRTRIPVLTTELESVFLDLALGTSGIIGKNSRRRRETSGFKYTDEVTVSHICALSVESIDVDH